MEFANDAAGPGKPPGEERKLLESVSETYAAFHAAGRELARYHQRRRDTGNTIRILRMLAAGSIPEDRAFYLMAIGAEYERVADWANALEAYKEALLLEPTDKKTWYFAHNNTGFCLLNLRKHEEAERFLRDAIDIDRGRHNAHKNLGRALQGLGRAREAAIELALAAAMAPNDPRALAHLELLISGEGSLLMEDPEVEEAVSRARLAASEWQSTECEGRMQEEAPSVAAESCRERVSSHGPKTVALLDDEPAFIEIITELLNEQGYRVVSSEYKQVFFDALALVPVDAIITDIRSPGMDGFEFLRAIKAIRKWSSIPVIVYSGNADKYATRLMDLGAFACLQKPAEITALIGILEKAIGGKHRR